MGEIEDLLADGTIISVDPDLKKSHQELNSAIRQLKTAASMYQDDPLTSFLTAYDAMRRAIVAHMRAGGYRIRQISGSHYKTGKYARAILSAAGIDPHLDQFDLLRTIRNEAEYEGLDLEPADVAEALEHAEAIVSAIADILGDRSSFHNDLLP